MFLLRSPTFDLLPSNLKILDLSYNNLTGKWLIALTYKINCHVILYKVIQGVL